MKNLFLVLLTCILVLSSTATSQTRRHASAKSRARAAKAAAEKSAAEVKAGRERVATQIKTLTHFLYLLGGIAKGIESVDQAVRGSPGTIEQNERNKAKLKESLKTVREGLDKLANDFRYYAALSAYSTYVTSAANLATQAEHQAAGNRFDDAGKSLLEAVGQLADALAAMR
ncbi:MAG: hypothetical protein HY231_20990 [Acidobacteria bacterium]|nr:hypothetical protein [Acidobacteriota bacterium]